MIGRNAVTGEWGHNPLPWPTDDERPGLVCDCGLSGCLETFISGTGLSRQYQAAGGDPVPAHEIVARSAADAPNAVQSIALYENRLARALAAVINLFDPDAIVLGGGMSNVDRLYENVPKLWSQWVFSDTVETPLLAPKYGDSSGVRGAAWLWDQPVHA